MSDKREVTIRRAPKLPVFLIVGGALGAIVTLVLTGLYPADPNIGFAATFGYFLLYGVPAGVALGALVGLIIDRVSIARALTVTAEHEAVSSPAELESTAPKKRAPRKK